MKKTEIEGNLMTIIERIKWIRETKAILSKEELDISVPLMRNLDYVGNVYDFFMSLQDPKRKSMIKKQFIFIILYLYSPSSLGGTKMRRGLREKLSDVLGCTCSNVSHDYKNVSFYYVTYKTFRNEINEKLIKILLEFDIKEKGAY